MVTWRCATQISLLGLVAPAAASAASGQASPTGVSGGTLQATTDQSGSIKAWPLARQPSWAILAPELLVGSAKFVWSA